MNTRRLWIFVVVIAIAAALSWLYHLASGESGPRDIHYPAAPEIYRFNLTFPEYLDGYTTFTQYLSRSPETKILVDQAIRELPDFADRPEDAFLEFEDSRFKVGVPVIRRYQLRELRWIRSEYPKDREREANWLEEIPRIVESVLADHPRIDEVHRDEKLQRELASLMRTATHLSDDAIQFYHGWEDHPEPPDETWEARRFRLEKARGLLQELIALLPTLEEPLVPRRLFLPWVIAEKARFPTPADRILSSDFLVREGFEQRWNHRSLAEIRRRSMHALNERLFAHAIPIELRAVISDVDQEEPNLEELTELLIQSPALSSAFDRATYIEFRNSASVTLFRGDLSKRKTISFPFSAPEALAVFEQLSQEFGDREPSSKPVAATSSSRAERGPPEWLHHPMSDEDWRRVRAQRDRLEEQWLPPETIVQVDRSLPAPVAEELLKKLELAFRKVDGIPELLRVELSRNRFGWGRHLPPSSTPRRPIARVLSIKPQTSGQEIVEALFDPPPAPEKGVRRSARRQRSPTVPQKLDPRGRAIRGKKYPPPLDKF